MLKPLGDRIVIKVEEKETTVGGLVLAGSGKETTKQATVIAVGEGIRTLQGDLVAPSVAAGDAVIVEAHAGIEVEDAGNKVLIVREAEILAIVE